MPITKHTLRPFIAGLKKNLNGHWAFTGSLALWLMADTMRSELETMLSTSPLVSKPEGDFKESDTQASAIPSNLRAMVEAMVPVRMPNDVDILVSRNQDEQFQAALLELCDNFVFKSETRALVWTNKPSFPTNNVPKIVMTDRGWIEGEILGAGKKYGSLVGNVVVVNHVLLDEIPVVNPLLMLWAKRKIFKEAVDMSPKGLSNPAVNPVLADIARIETFLEAFITWFVRKADPKSSWDSAITRAKQAHHMIVKGYAPIPDDNQLAFLRKQLAID